MILEGQGFIGMNDLTSRASIANDHRAAFSQRLLEAMTKSGYKEAQIGPTLLSRLFNSHYQGKGITVHAARKWLIGEAIPTQEKLVALARILNVAPDWLAFGVAHDEQTRDAKVSPLSPDDAHMLAEFRQLGARDQDIARGIITLLKLNLTKKERVKT